MSTAKCARAAVRIHPAVDLSTLRARYDRLASEYDRMCSRVMVEHAEVRRLGRVGRRQIDRLIAAERRAAVAESALATSQTRPGACVRLLLRAERLLYRLSYPQCPSCGLTPLPHRHNCRIDSLLAAIRREIPV